MGIYEYQCPHGHMTELFVPLSAKPSETPCSTPGCDQKATSVMSATPTTFRAMDRKAFKRSGR